MLTLFKVEQIQESDKSIFSIIIRNKLELIQFLLQLLRYFLIKNPILLESEISQIDDVDNNYNIVISQDRMRRVFLFSPHKYLSIYFPFRICRADLQLGKVVFALGNEKIVLDYYSISIFSELIELVKMEKHDEFLDRIIEIYSDSIEIYKVFLYLLRMDDGYLRYDYDPEHYVKDKHPLHHLDIFYSQNSTFKVGLENAILPIDMHELLNIHDNCRFIR